MTKYNLDKIVEIIKEKKSKAECLRALDKRPAGANYKWLDRIIKKHSIDISHFTGQGWNVGNRKRHTNYGKSFEEILVANSDYASSNKLKQRLIKAGIKKHACEECLNETWNGKPIPIELEHCNGINTDNRIENLKILCPNCHAQTPFYRGKNKLSSRAEKRELNRVKFGETLTGNTEPSLINNKEGVETLRREPKPKLKNCECGKQIRVAHKKCRECDNLSRKTFRPSYEQLLEDFKILKSKVQVGNKYGVSDNAVNKWLKLYQIDLDMVKIKSSAQTEMVVKTIV